MNGTEDEAEKGLIMFRLYGPRSISTNVVRLTEINLSGQNLGQVPESLALFFHSGLTLLDLSGNQFTSLPSSFSSDRTLEILNVSRNKLTYLPKWITGLIKLKSIDISRNPLDEDGCSQLGSLGHSCRRLRKLNASNCSFATIPVNLCQSRDIVRINFGNSDDEGGGTQLLDTISNAASNSSLMHSQGRTNESQTKYKNDIYEVPPYIADLLGVVELNLANANISSIPRSIGYLVFLERLDLRNNKLNGIPFTFSSLTRLKVLKLSRNFIEELPYQFEILPNLEELYLDHNQLTWIPEKSSNMKKLKVLDLYDNRLDCEGLIGLDQLAPQLDSLDLGFNKVSLRRIVNKMGIENYTDLEAKLRSEHTTELRYSPASEDSESEQEISDEDESKDQGDEEYSNQNEESQSQEANNEDDWGISPSVPVTKSRPTTVAPFCPADYHPKPLKYNRIHFTVEDGQFSDADEEDYECQTKDI